ncbi:hypothetical protein GC176_24870 [bacterium]|nr:hypothetical protein [bacterium]
MPNPFSVKAPSIVEHVILACASLLMLEQHSRLPESNPILFLLCGPVVAALGCSYLARVVVGVGNRGLNQSDGFLRVDPSGKDTAKPHSFLNWLVFPVTFALLLSSTATHWPASVRFALSRSSFDELVAQAYQGKKLDGFPRRVGLYWIESVYDYDFNYDTREGTVGFVTGACLIDECGLCYDRRNRDSSHWLTTKIAPCWYVTEW